MSQESSPITVPRRKFCCICLREFDDKVQLCPVDLALLTPLYFDTPQLGSALNSSIKVRGTIAEGRVARILLCQTDDDRLLALRMLKRLEQRYISAFLQEAQTLARLDHPRIVKLQAAGLLGRGPYMMLQFIAGGNLAARLGDSKALPFETVVLIAKQICEALLYLDEKGVSYPILKPEHVMFLDEQHSEVCLIDLSHTFFAHDDQNASVGGAIFLNPNYSAPEVLMGRPPTILSSAYSVSCLIHRCLTGENLFGAQTDLQLATKHMSEKLPAVDWSKYGVPSDFEQVLVAALTKSPSERATVQELAAITAKYTD